MKTCSKCRQTKELSYFYPGTKSARCKECLRARGRAYYRANKEKWKERDQRYRAEDTDAFLRRSREAQARYRANPNNTIHTRYLKARYGITGEQYVDMFDRQSGCCAVCRRPSQTGR